MMSKNKTRVNVSNDLDGLIEVAKASVLSSAATGVARSELFYKEIIGNLQEALKDYFVMDDSFYLGMILPLAIKTTNNKADTIAAVSKMVSLMSSDSSFKCGKGEILVLMSRSITGMQYISSDIGKSIESMNRYIEEPANLSKVSSGDLSIAKKVLAKIPMIRANTFDMWSNSCSLMKEAGSIDVAVSRIETMLLCLSVCKNTGKFFGVYGKKDNSTFLSTLKNTVSELSKLRSKGISKGQEEMVSNLVMGASRIDSNIDKVNEAISIVSSIPISNAPRKDGRDRFEDVPPDFFPDDASFEDVPPDFFPDDASFEDVPPDFFPDDHPDSEIAEAPLVKGEAEPKGIPDSDIPVPKKIVRSPRRSPRKSAASL